MAYLRGSFGLSSWVVPVCVACSLSALVSLTVCTASAQEQPPLPVPTSPSRPVDVILDYENESPDLQRERLIKERASLTLAGPIVVLAIGGGVLIAGGVTFMIGALVQADCAFDTTCPHKPWMHAGVPLMILGATTAALGGVWLGVRLSHRRKLDRQIEVGLMPRPLGTGLQAQWRF